MGGAVHRRRRSARLESIGDITATAALSGKRTTGPKFEQRLRGGLTMDAVSGAIGAALGGLPLTTLSQNNGLISQAGLHDWCDWQTTSPSWKRLHSVPCAQQTPGAL